MSSYQYIYNSQLDAFSLYHLTHEAKAARPSAIGPALPALGHAMSGSLGTAVSKLVTYPLDLVVTRLQVQKQLQNDDEKARYDGILDAIEKIYEREGGIAAFYSGVLHETAKGVADSFLFFLAYSYVRQSRLAANGGRKSLPALEEIGVGVVAGAFSKFWTTPIQNIVTRKQTAAMLKFDSPDGSPSMTTKQIAQGIYNEKGLQGFWSGYSASLILTLNPSITMLLHKIILRLLVPKSKRDDPGARITFLVAAVSKAMASTLTYPFSLAKTRAQVSAQKPTDASGETSEIKERGTSLGPKATRARQRTVFSTILRIAQTEGLWGLYQGLGAEVLKGFFSHGITMLMKERIHTAIVNLYYVVLKATKKYPSPDELATMASDEVKGAYAHGKEQIGDAYAKGVEVAGQAAEKVREAVTEGSHQAQGLVESGREQASQAYAKASEAAQATSSTAQGLAETSKENASAVYAKADAAAESASSSVQQAVTNGSRQAGEFVEQGKDAADAAATRAKNAVLEAEVRDVDGVDNKGIKE